jgi:undecaprenyl-diphosphatase
MRTLFDAVSTRLYRRGQGQNAGYDACARRGVRVGLRSATGNRVLGESRVAGSNPALSASVLGGLLEEGDEVGELGLVQLVAVDARHDPRLETGGDLGVRVDDRLVDEVGALPLQDLVEIGAHLAGGARGGECVAAAASRLGDGGEDLLARLGVAGGRLSAPGLGRRSGRGRGLLGCGAPSALGREVVAFPEHLDGGEHAEDQESGDDEEETQVTTGETDPAPRQDNRDDEAERHEHRGDNRQDDVVPVHGRAYDTRVRRRSLHLAAAAAILAAALIAALGVRDRPGALSDWQAFALGIVQGLTELLPISSSGHLILVPWLGDWTYLEQHPDFNKTFDVALHLGTLVAVVAYFREEIVRLTRAWLGSVRRRRIETTDERIAWFVFAATIPAAFAGAVGESFVEKRLGEPWQIAVFLAVGAIALWLADRLPERKQIGDLSFPQAVGVGIAQALALAPGVSRSGITITAGRFLGLNRDAAARFSFFLLVPIVLGAVLFKGWTDVIGGDLPPGWGEPFLVGTLAAAGSGLFAIDALLGYVRRHDYSIFVLYRLAAAAFVLVLIASGVRDATF